MKITELLEAAKAAQGSYGAVAKATGVTQNRISDWKNGDRKPTTGQIGLLAELAKLPVMETIASVEAEMHSDFAELWGRIVGKMKAAGVTAAATLVLGIYSMTAPNDAYAYIGGNGEIRTHGGRKTPAVFKTAAFNRSATLPLVEGRILTYPMRFFGGTHLSGDILVWH